MRNTDIIGVELDIVDGFFYKVEGFGVGLV